MELRDSVKIGAIREASDAVHRASATLISQRPSVEVLNRNAFKVDSCAAANIDCGDPVDRGIGAFSL